MPRNQNNNPEGNNQYTAGSSDRSERSSSSSDRSSESSKSHLARSPNDGRHENEGRPSGSSSRSSR